MSDIKNVTEVIAKQMEVYEFPFEKVWDEYVPGAIKLEFTKEEVFSSLKEEYDELFLSPLPWTICIMEILDNDGEHVAQFEKDKDILYTMKCIKMHEELIALIKNFKHLCETGIIEFDKDVLIKRIDDILKRDNETNFENI
jgi:hypothetical protein